MDNIKYCKQRVFEYSSYNIYFLKLSVERGEVQAGSGLKFQALRA